MKKLKGIIAALVTPLKENDTFDHAGMKRLVRYVLSHDVDGVFVLGSAGESPCFTSEERKRVIRAAVREVNGRVPVLAGAGKNTTKETIESVSHAEKCGADYAVVMPPVWRPGWVSQENLVAHYRTIAEKSRIPVILYNLPKEAAPITPLAAKRLKDARNIAGIKDSSCSLKLIRDFAKHMPVFQGDDTRILPALAKGAVGAISGMASVFPGLLAEIYNRYEKNQIKPAREAQQKVSMLTNKVFEICRKNPLACEKYCLEIMGICKGFVRKPYTQLAKKEKDAVSKVFKPYLA